LSQIAGEHFTPREANRLMVNLIFAKDDEVPSSPGVVRTIYDPTAGTGRSFWAGLAAHLGWFSAVHAAPVNKMRPVVDRGARFCIVQLLVPSGGALQTKAFPKT
jgi:hypothetical protein